MYFVLDQSGSLCTLYLTRNFRIRTSYHNVCRPPSSVFGANWLTQSTPLSFTFIRYCFVFLYMTVFTENEVTGPVGILTIQRQLVDMATFISEFVWLDVVRKRPMRLASLLFKFALFMPAFFIYRVKLESGNLESGGLNYINKFKIQFWRSSDSCKVTWKVIGF